MTGLFSLNVKRCAFGASLKVIFLLGMTSFMSPQLAESANPGFDPSIRPQFKEPVTLASKNGVLEVTLRAHQGHASLDTVKKPVEDFLVYAYEVIRSVPSDDKRKEIISIPGRLYKYIRRKLIIHYQNALSGLTIRDYYDPAFTPKGGEVPLYPPQLTQAPINLHTHGLRISPEPE